MKNLIFSTCLLIFLILSGCRSSKNNPDDEITIFCAACVTNVLTEMKDSFQVHNPALLKLNFASSGTLARQIEQGSVPDIFISASREWADYADSLGYFSKKKPICSNQLVLIAPIQNKTDTVIFNQPEPPAFSGRLSMGDPSHVPAGRYALEALTSLGWYESIEDRILPALDVRSALMIVEMGECELGIVYYSDAIQSEKIKIAGFFPESSHEPIVLQALLVKNPSKASEEFFDLLTNPSSDSIWLKNGFIPLDFLVK